MPAIDKVKEHMEVIGADGVHVGTVDRVEGNRIRLTKKDSGEGSHKDHHHFVDRSLVAGVEGGVVTRAVGIVGRVGYTGHSLATDPAPFSWGAGVELGRLHLDYGYRASGRSRGNSTHRIGVRWSP